MTKKSLLAKGSTIECNSWIGLINYLWILKRKIGYHLEKRRHALCTQLCRSFSPKCSIKHILPPLRASPM